MAQTVAYFCFYCTKVKLETPVTKKTVTTLHLTWNHCGHKITTAVNSNTNL